MLYYGDNLDVMPDLEAESVDLIYLDPPFNSAKNYNVIFERQEGAPKDASAQIQAFTDTWKWTSEVAAEYDRLVNGGLPVRPAEALASFHRLLGPTDALAYLVNMAPRLVQLRRLLKPTGSVYLHCDQTMAHYLKVLMDSIFGIENFLNNVVWLYGLGGSSKRYWPRKHDDLLWYSKTPMGHYFEADRVPATSSRMKGQTKKAPDYWDIPSLNNMAKERLGYPTQKPLALLERIVASSCPPGGVVLDPFCGCGTALDASQKLDRGWIGIDITYIAVDLIEKRLLDRYPESIAGTYEVAGVPRDEASAAALFARNPFDFERWAVSRVGAQPNEKQVGDRGIDGVARFPLGGPSNFGRILVSVKGGKSLNPAMVRDLSGTLSAEGAEMGILITQHPITRGMQDALGQAGFYSDPLTGRTYARLQAITTGELLAGQKPDTPATVLPYMAAQAARGDDTSTPLDFGDDY